MNIEAIQTAKALWKLECKKGDHDVATKEDLAVHLKNGVFPTCPNGGTYSINANDTRATCSIHTTAPAKQ